MAAGGVIKKVVRRFVQTGPLSTTTPWRPIRRDCCVLPARESRAPTHTHKSYGAPFESSEDVPEAGHARAAQSARSASEQRCPAREVVIQSRAGCHANAMGPPPETDAQPMTRRGTTRTMRPDRDAAAELWLCVCPGVGRTAPERRLSGTRTGPERHWLAPKRLPCGPRA